MSTGLEDNMNLLASLSSGSKESGSLTDAHPDRHFIGPPHVRLPWQEAPLVDYCRRQGHVGTFYDAIDVAVKCSPQFGRPPQKKESTLLTTNISLMEYHLVVPYEVELQTLHYRDETLTVDVLPDYQENEDKDREVVLVSL